MQVESDLLNTINTLRDIEEDLFSIGVILDEAQNALQRLRSIFLSWCYRECILVAHNLAQNARFTSDEFIVWLEDKPDFLNFDVSLTVN